jgi:O-antigen/teichoic acid export membrane protein
MQAGKSKVWIVLKNALASALRGGIAALIAIPLTRILTKSLPTSTFGAWGLILQLGAYVGVLDLGLQTSVGRFVAHYNELRQPEQRDRIISTALAALTALAAVAVAGLLILAWELPNIFKEMPANLHGEARTALLVVGTSLALSLPFGVFNGIFAGLQRNEIPTVIVVTGRVIAAVLMVLAVKGGGGLIWMAVAAATANVLTALAQFWACRRVAPDIKLARGLASRTAGRELFDYCFSLSIWSVSMLLVSGLSTTIVGVVDFKSVAFFTVAVSVTNALVGLQNSAFSALMPVAAALGARQDARRLGDMLIASTRYGMLMLLLSGLPIIFGAFPLLKLWVGSNYALHAQALLQVLLAAQIVRLSATPYAVLLIGTGQQRLVIWTPLIEGATNLISSLLLGSRFGAIGVAWGTMVGALVGLTCHFAYNMRRTTSISFLFRHYFWTGILRPLAAVLPIIPMTAALHLYSSAAGAATAIALGSGIVLVVSLWRLAVTGAEREKLLRFFL